MANVKNKKELDALSNAELVKYLDSISLTNFNSYIDADTKVRYFIYVYGEGIAKAIQGSGLFFPAVTALKITESGYGKRIPLGSFNFGGTKYNSSIHKAFVEADTTEVVNGQKIAVKARFAKFENAEDGMKQNIQVLLGNRYKKARAATTPENQILEIAKAGYTTTPATEYLKVMKGNIKRIAKKTGFGKIA